MSTRSPSVYFISVLMHGSVVALILFFAYWANQSAADAPKVFELVAGAGNNYAATEAPALGAPDGIKLNVPTESQLSAAAPPPPEAAAAPPEPVPPAPTPPAPAVQEEAPPIKAAPLVPAKAPAKPKPKSDAVPNLTKVLQRTESRRTARLMAKYRKQLAAQEKQEQMSYEQYLKEHGAAAARRNAEGIAGGVVGGSTSNKSGGAGGKALSRAQEDALDAYFALLKSRIKENHVAPPDVSDTLMAVVGFYLSADGVMSRVHIVRSSGSSIFDQSVLEAFAHTRSIGPRPDGRGDTAHLEFTLRDEE